VLCYDCPNAEKTLYVTVVVPALAGGSVLDV